MKSLPISFIAAKNQSASSFYDSCLNSDFKYRPLSIFNFRIMNMLEDNESDSQAKLILARGCQQANNIGFNYFYMF